MKNIARNGFSLIAVILCISFILTIAVSISRLIILSSVSAKERLDQSKVFYLSEAGIETAKSLIAGTPTWETDMSHTDNDKQWLLALSSGKIYLFGEGGFKIVKEHNKMCVYSIGFLGSDILKSKSYSFQKISYVIPFAQKSWEMF